MTQSARDFNTEVRAPFNGPISHILKAIDAHTALYLKGGGVWHLEQAQVLRGYVRGLKEWIKAEEQRH